MYIVIFYDRKNNCEVNNTQLRPLERYVNLGQLEGENINKTVGVHKQRLSTFCYKSKKCSKFKAWDMTCGYEDLIFLRLEYVV